MISRRRTMTMAAALLLCVIAAPAGAQAPAAPPAQTGEPVAVMTYNIRYGTAKDGDDDWAHRKAMLFALLRRENPDLVGLQEALRFQIDEIVAAVPGYGVVGVGRDDGKAAGEATAILYRAARFSVAESGTFWFSDTPEVVASKTWGNRITRISTWARLIDRDGSALWHFNLHLDHESQPSREKSTALLLQRVGARRYPAEPVVVTGDFNVGESNPAIHTLVGTPGRPTGSPAPPLVDTYRVLHPDDAEVGTFTAFKPGATRGDKIDYILVPPGTTVQAASIVRSAENGHYPSDHFPVTATIRFAR
jgi:endonuclease/exonuclease/phosphatase family metal-dependent hydrolase